MNIIYFDWFQSATEYYRLAPLDYINHPSINITRSTEKSITWALLNKYDTVILSRPSSNDGLNLVKLAKEMGKHVVLDFDDSVLRLNPENPMYGLYESEKGNSIKCLALADEVWVATKAIADTFRLYNKNIHIIPNCLNDYLFKDKKPFKFTKTVMYRGGGSHIGDMYALGTPEKIISLVNGNKKHGFYFLGQRFEYIEMRIKHGNYFINSGATTIQFYKLMADIKASLFFYPLSDHEFNRGKSSCSFIEATYAGCAYFGCKNLPEFNLDCIIDINELWGKDSKIYLNNVDDILEKKHNESWEYIQNNLLLSKVNEIRKQRLLEI